MAADAKTITELLRFIQARQQSLPPLPEPLLPPELLRFIQARQQSLPPLPEPLLPPELLRFIQALQRQPLPEPLSRFREALQQPLPEPWVRGIRSLAEFSQGVDIRANQIAHDICQQLQPRPATVAPRRAKPRPSDAGVLGAVTTLGDMPELKLWSAVKKLPGLAGARRSQVTLARWAIFGHPSKGRRGKTPKKPKLVAVGTF